MKKYILLTMALVFITGLLHSKVGDRNQPKNLQVLNIETIGETKKFMKQMSKDLGVKCKFCHDLDNFALDTDHKKNARHMMKMTSEINENYFSWEGAKGVSCWTCHQGQKEPPEKE